MPLSSMTGFSRASGTRDGFQWQWEIRSVNGKGLDVRCRLPPGFEHLELAVREAAARHVKRGNLQAGLSCNRAASSQAIVVNELALEQVTALAEKLRMRLGGDPPRVEGLLALRGVLDIGDTREDESETKARDANLLKSFESAIASLAAMRLVEGAKTAQLLREQLSRIEQLTIAARDCPARSVEAIRARLADQVQRLLEANASFDRDRLHQEAILLATRADIQEEIDRLFAHVGAARDLLQTSEPAGRKFDFLAQEFNREANTLCSKASDRLLTQIGLDLKTVIDQMREQVQNLE